VTDNIDLDIFDEILSTARSVRRKLDFERPLPRQLLFDCIDVAVQAPTGISGESWRFLIVDEPAAKQAIAELYREVLLTLLEERGMPLKATHKALIDRLHDIPAMIFVCVNDEPLDEQVSSQVAYYGSILPAAWRCVLAVLGQPGRLCSHRGSRRWRRFWVCRMALGTLSCYPLGIPRVRCCDGQSVYRLRKSRSGIAGAGNSWP